MIAYLYSVGTSISQVLNALRGGSPDMTLSATVWVASELGDQRAARAVAIINHIFFWERNHCRASWGLNVMHAHEVIGTVTRIQEARK